MTDGLTLVALVLLAAAAGRWGGWWSLALAAVSVLWLVVNGSMEGAVLIRVNVGHGLTAADLAGFAGFAVATIAALLTARDHSQIEPGSR